MNGCPVAGRFETTGTEAEAAVLGDQVGSFRFLIAGERWEWSDEVARMHGYEQGCVAPTTELVLSHKHADDKRAVTALVDNMIRDGQPFSSRHRIIDTHGRVRIVVVVGDRLVDETGAVVGTTGFYVDITDSYESDVQRRLGQATKSVAAERAVIERARGILMYVYGFSAGDAAERVEMAFSGDWAEPARVLRAVRARGCCGQSDARSGAQGGRPCVAHRARTGS